MDKEVNGEVDVETGKRCADPNVALPHCKGHHRKSSTFLYRTFLAKTTLKPTGPLILQSKKDFDSRRCLKAPPIDRKRNANPQLLQNRFLTMSAVSSSFEHTAACFYVVRHWICRNWAFPLDVYVWKK